MKNQTRQQRHTDKIFEDIQDMDKEWSSRRIEDWHEWRKNEGHATSTISKEIGRLRVIFEYAQSDPVKMTSSELNRLVGRIARDRDHQDNTKRNYQKAVRSLIESAIDSLDETDDPKRETELKRKHRNINLTKVEKTEEYNKDELILREDISKILNAISDIRMKALLALLWEGGYRSGAICQLKIENYNRKNNGEYSVIKTPKVEGVKGADGNEKALLWSTGYIERYQDEHEWWDSLESPDNPDMPLFPTQGKNQYEAGQHISTQQVYTVVKKACKATAGIDADKIHPHSFRHGRATNLAKQGHTKREIEQMLDWDEDTDQHERYEHTADKDTINNYLDRKAVDVDIEDEPEDNTDDCPRCKTTVLTGLDYCPRCSLRLSDDRPLWYRIYLTVAPDNNEISKQFEGGLPHHDPARLSPRVFQHVRKKLFTECYHVLHEDLDVEPHSIEIVGKRPSGALVCVDPSAGIEIEKAERLYETVFSEETMAEHAEHHESHYRYSDDDYIDPDNFLSE